MLKWVGIVCAMLLLGGCTPVAEFARGYDRELVAGNRGGKNFVEYRIGKKAEKLKTEKLKLEEQRELVAMVVQLLDEINAGKLPVSEKIGSGGASPSKEVIK